MTWGGGGGGADREWTFDPRAAALRRGTTPGSARPVTRADWEAEARTWPTSPRTPEAVARQLTVARQLFVHSLLVWEFGAVGVAWSLMAVESMLRAVMPPGSKRHESYEALIRRAAGDGVVDQDLAQQLHTGRRLRNGFAHPDGQPAWSPGMVADGIRISHTVVVQLAAARDEVDAQEVR